MIKSGEVGFGWLLQKIKKHFRYLVLERFVLVFENIGDEVITLAVFRTALNTKLKFKMT